MHIFLMIMYGFAISNWGIFKASDEYLPVG